MIFHVDLGQIIIAVLIATVGYFLKKEVTTFGIRLDRHDAILIKLVGDVQRLIGISESRKNRRGE
jgi:hypothetical protein